MFCTNDVCTMRYDVICHPFPINSQYLKKWGVDSPAMHHRTKGHFVSSGFSENKGLWELLSRGLTKPP